MLWCYAYTVLVSSCCLTVFVPRKHRAWAPIVPQTRACAKIYAIDLWYLSHSDIGMCECSLSNIALFALILCVEQTADEFSTGTISCWSRCRSHSEKPSSCSPWGPLEMRSWNLQNASGKSRISKRLYSFAETVKGGDAGNAKPNCLLHVHNRPLICILGPLLFWQSASAEGFLRSLESFTFWHIYTVLKNAWESVGVWKQKNLSSTSSQASANSSSAVLRSIVSFPSWEQGKTLLSLATKIVSTSSDCNGSKQHIQNMHKYVPEDKEQSNKVKIIVCNVKSK